MKTIYNLLHFSKRKPKRLHIAIPDTEPDLGKEEALVLSIVSEDKTQVFTLTPSEISGFIKALSYGCDMLQWRRIVAINQKYFTKEVKK